MVLFSQANTTMTRLAVTYRDVVYYIDPGFVLTINNDDPGSPNNFTLTPIPKQSFSISGVISSLTPAQVQQLAALLSNQITAVPAVKSRIFTFPTPQTTWMLNHNMNGYPSLTCVDKSNSEINGDVDYLDANTISLSFSEPESGIAFLN